ncbi:WD40/YVTN/BNR-like repeat-containing protein [Halosegnis sp.]|uniref:WD40/YVTN/BNR-like repeat-containing protein n=1 Tax=Halosegnis sp. TaxID=2864959 RepID=UPI0035D3F3F6
MLAAFPDRLVADDGTLVPPAEVTCLARGGGTTLVGTVEGAYTLESDEQRFTGHVTALAFDDRTGEWWLGTEPSAVYRSSDGREWTERPGLTDLPSSDEWSFPPRPDTHHVRWLAPDPTRPGRWYVAVEAGALVRTDDAGATWEDRVAGARRDTHELAVHPKTGRLYCAAGDGYAESTDGGETWRYPQSGLDEQYCWSVAVGGDPDLRVLSAARSATHAHRRGVSSVYRNAGDGWEQVDELPAGEGVYRSVVRRDGDGFLAVSNRGLYRGDATATEWQQLRPPDDLPNVPPVGLLTGD